VTKPGLWPLTRYFLWLGSAGFGGPIALAGYMHRDLVERRGWIAADEYREGLALAQLAPGPLAAQLAIYIGWLGYGVVGATLAGIAFVLPSFVMVLGLSMAYVRFGGLPWMQGAFYGIGAAVIAIIARSAVKLTRATLKHDRLRWALWLVSAVVTATTGRELVSVVLACGLAAMLARSRPGAIAARAGTAAALLPLPLVLAVSDPVPLRILWYFAEAGFFVFGSGLAIIPFLYGGVVHDFHWLNERQFLDAIAVSMITPGPVVITVSFIGYLVAGPLGATLAAVGVFAPVWLVTIIAAPHFKRLLAHPEIDALVRGVTAAATGAIAGAAVVLGRRALVDGWTALLFIAVLGALLLRKKVPEPALIALAGITGVLLRG
jgi:chromate transporter